MIGRMEAHILNISNFRWNNSAISVPARSADLFRDCIAFMATALFSSWSASAVSKEIYVFSDAKGRANWSTQAVDERASLAFSVESTISGPRSQAAAPRDRRLASKPSRVSPDLLTLIEEACREHGLDPDMVIALIQVESRFNTNAVSPKGARGLMQLMPATAKRYGITTISELHNPAQNLDAGMRHLKELLKLHKGNWALAIASYNAGEYAVARHGARIPRFQETMLYVPAVFAAAAKRKAEISSISDSNYSSAQ